MSLFAVDVSVDRGCCEVKDGSPICPPGPDFQIDETVDYTRYMSRCARDLCNDSEGDEPQAPPPDGTCLVDNFACEIEDDNLMGVVNGVPNITACLDDDAAHEADYVTYFGQTGFPFVDTCLFFNACETLGAKFRSRS